MICCVLITLLLVCAYGDAGAQGEKAKIKRK